MTQITPSVGRKVWFYNGDTQLEPHDATIVKVHATEWQANPFTRVNLMVTNPDTGEQTFWTDVTCSPNLVPYPHFRWMPYQEKQAAREGVVDGPCAVAMNYTVGAQAAKCLG